MPARGSAIAALSSLLVILVFPKRWMRAAALGGGVLLLIGSGSTAFGGLSRCAKREIAKGPTINRVKAARRHLIGSELNTLSDPDNWWFRSPRLFANFSSIGSC